MVRDTKLKVGINEISEAQTFPQYLRTVHPSSIESRSGSCVMISTYLKAEQYAVLMNFLELII